MNNESPVATDRRMIDMEDRIAKLLALAEGTSNPLEAEAFTAKAEALMIKYGIEQAQLQAAGKVKVEQIIVAKRRYEGVSYAKVQMQLGYAVARALNLQAHYMVGSERGVYVLTIVGHEGDVERALQLIDSLQLQAAAAMQTWWKAERARFAHLHAKGQRTERRTFILAYSHSAAARAKAVYVHEVEEATATSAGTDLVLRDRSKQVADFYFVTFPNLGRGKSSNYGSLSSTLAGRAAGEKANVGARGSLASRQGISR